MNAREPYPNDVSDEELKFVAPYLSLVRLSSPTLKTHSRIGPEIPSGSNNAAFVSGITSTVSPVQTGGNNFGF